MTRSPRPSARPLARIFTGLALVVAVAGSARADDDDDDDDDDDAPGEETGYRDVELVDGGPTRMQDKRDYQMALIPGVSFIPPGFKLRFQYLLSDRMTLIVGGGYAGFGYTRESSADVDADGQSDVTSGSTSDWTRYHGIVGFDFQPIGNGMHGFYVGPRVLYRKGQTNFGIFGSDVGSVRTVLVGRAIIGYSVVMDPGIVQKFGVGLGYRTVTGTTSASTGSGSSAESSSSIKGTVPTLEWNVGWAF